jgi:hypothetical protein
MNRIEVCIQQWLKDMPLMLVLILRMTLYKFMGAMDI